MGRFNIKLVTQDDVSLLWDVLYEICCDRARRKGEILPTREVLQTPNLAKYVQDWGRIGDEGLVAIHPNRQLIGSIWYRLFSEDNKGFGYINEETPEIAFGIFPDYRGQGLGQVLLARLLQHAKLSYQQISLSVDPTNSPALHLYQKFGFEKVGEHGDSWIMKKDL